MRKPFEPSRPDGRSDRRVIVDLVEDAEPDTTFDYDTIIAALSDGLDKPVERRRIYRAVTNANKLLLRERRRYLKVVPNVGYRMIRADEHLPVAIDKKNEAVTKLQRGVELLRHARLDELPEAQQVLHDGQLMILSGLHDALVGQAKRIERHDSLITEVRERQRRDVEDLAERLGKIEQRLDED